MPHIPLEQAILAATTLWGEPTLRTVRELRFGHRQSKSLNLVKQVWNDHETGEGGGLKSLLIKAGMWEEKPMQNGRDGVREFEAIYPYRDEHGVELYQQVRNWPGHGQRFFVRRRVNGHWERSLGETRRVLYRLRDLLDTPLYETVFVVEGEKDVETLVELGFIATCNPFGAGKWRDEYTPFLANRPIVLIPDNDAPGREHMADVARRVEPVARSLVMLALPGLGEKGDVSDFIAAGGTREDLIELVREARAEPPKWLDQCQLTDSKSPKPENNLVNAHIAVISAPHLRRALRYDAMKRVSSLQQSDLRPITDADITEIQLWMQNRGLRKIPREAVYHAIEMIALQRPFHPIQAWFAATAWDGIERVPEWTSTYLKAAPTAYNHAVGRMFLIAMVARIFRPGCPADYMVILEGEQGTYKSTACRVLASDAYFSDCLPNLNDKDVSIHLRGKWLIEIPELHAFSRHESTQLKAFISTREERYRPPYGQHDVFEPRQCLFIGTSNKDNYLKDETGGRRFWPIKCGRIAIDDLKRDRDQLLAEAKHRFDRGELWWPTPEFETAHIKPEQDARFEEDAWTPRVRDFIRLHTRVTIAEVAQAIGLGLDRVGRADQMRISQILQSLGCVRRRSATEKWYQVPDVLL